MQIKCRLVVAASCSALAAMSHASEALLADTVPDRILAEQRGGAVVTTNIMDLQAGLTNNTARRAVTGTNTVQDGAFTNASGLATVIQNSGNNVIIQNATIINLEMK